MNFIKVSCLIAQAQCLTNWGGDSRPHDCLLSFYRMLTTLLQGVCCCNGGQYCPANLFDEGNCSVVTKSARVSCCNIFKFIVYFVDFNRSRNQNKI